MLKKWVACPPHAHEREMVVKRISKSFNVDHGER